MTPLLKYTSNNSVRYPVVFASVLVLGAVAFTFRKNFLGDFEKEKNNLNRGYDHEGAKLIEEKIREHKSARIKS